MSDLPRRLLDRHLPDRLLPTRARMSNALLDAAEAEQRRHPGLNGDLTVAMLGALAEAAARVALYILHEDREREAAAARASDPEGGVH